MSTSELTQIVKQFIKNNDTFKLIHQTKSRPLLNPTTSRIMILDSSFNPPHLGHLSMIKKSILQPKTKIGVSTINTNSVLLLLSIKNADKQDVEYSEYVERIKMIQSMSIYVEQELGLSCGIALTNSSLFVGKNTLIREWINEYNSRVKSTYLLGFDTLIRFLDLKYYKDTLVNSLSCFFNTSSVIVFLRDDKSSKLAINDQEKYISTLDIPADWHNAITCLRSEDAWCISSSHIRELVGKGDESGWKPMVLPSIAEYISQNGRYSSSADKLT